MIFKSEDRKRATIKIHVPRNMDPRSMFGGTWILDPCSAILDPRSMFRDLGSKIQSTSLDNLSKILL